MSYLKSSYKSSSYRVSSSNDGQSTSSRLRGITTDDGDSSISSYTSRRTYNFDSATAPSSTSFDRDDSTSRRSLRLSSRYSTGDYDLDTEDTSAGTSSSRYSSKYKSLLSSSGGGGDDDDDNSFSRSRKYSRYSSRDESDFVPSTTSRYSRFSSMEGDDDLGISTASSRRQTSRLSYLDEDGDGRRESGLSYTRRYESDSYKNHRDDASPYKVTTPTEEESRYSFYSSTDGGDLSITKPRSYQRTSSSTSRTLSRLDSKDSSSGVGQVYEAILDYDPPRSATDEISLKEGQEVVILSKDKPHKWKVRTRRSKYNMKVQEGFAPSAYLKAKDETDLEMLDSITDTKSANKDEQATQKDLKKKKDMVVRELIETEEDLIRDMQFVKRTYIRQSESSITPKEIKAVKDDIFSCFKELLGFHEDVLLKNFQTLSKEPAKIGTMFLKLEDDFYYFDTKYCQNLKKALEILDENSDVNEFYTNYAAKIRDEKTLSDHLKLPYQRISDYQLLLKELSKHLARMDENVDDLEKAVKIIATIPEKSEPNDVDEDNNAQDAETAMRSEMISPINLLGGESSEKLSKMLKNVLVAKDYFDVIDSGGKCEERFIFLFKTRMFITEINKNISESQRTYNVKKIVKLFDVEVAPDESDASVLLIKPNNLSDKSFPIALRCKSVEQAKEWLDMIKKAPEIDDAEEDKAEHHNLIQQAGLQISEPGTKPLDENNNVNKGEIGATATSALVLTTASEPITKSEVNTSDTEKVSNAPNAALVPEKDIETNAPEESLGSGKKPSKKTSSKKKTARQVGTLEDVTAKVAEADASCAAPTVDAVKIVQPLKAQTRHVGESAVLECKVSTGNQNVQWLKDNKVLSGSNYKTRKSNDVYYLELTNLSPDDAGLYTVVASNIRQSASSSAILNVLSAGDSRPTSPGGSFLPHPPKFKVKLKDTELLEGTTVRFEIIVRGLPIPNISIFKDDKPLKEDDHLKVLFQSKEVFEIMIEHVRPEDAGVYKCVAVNTEGTDETSGRISVSCDKNVFWGLDESESDTMAVAIDDGGARSPGARSPAFKWFKDGKEFEASERFQVQFDDLEDNIVLVFQHVKPGDAGIYTCVASTSSGKISCSAELNVQGMVRELSSEPLAPVIKKELCNVSISEGESVAILEAQITGFPKPKITWFQENKALEANEHFKMLTEGEENYALVIKNVKQEDAATYRLQACNELGTADTSAKLTVLKKPTFGQVEDKVEVLNNEKLTIEAKYESVPMPEVKWQKDGVDIKPSKRIKSVVEKDHCRLIIDKAESEDIGTYRCIISNDLGRADRDVKVNVNSAPKFLKRLEAVEVFESEMAIFVAQCYAVPKAQIEFFKEAKRVEENKRIKIVEEEDGLFKLKIDKANLDDEGKYKCVIKNKYGFEEDEAELTIKRKQMVPEFRDKLKEVEAMVGDEKVKLEVQADGEPAPVMKWFHEGEEIRDGQKGVSLVDNGKGGSSLVIDHVTPEHGGVYMCQAENANGQIQTTGNLVVQGPPYVVKHLENVETSLDSDVTLTAIIKGNPSPQATWYHDNKEIKMDKHATYKYDESSAQYSLQIKKIENEDTGDYRIEAINKFGKCDSAAKVDVVSKPLFTKVLKNIVCKGVESNIELVTQLDKRSAQPLVKWFKDDREISDNEKNIKLVHDKVVNEYKLVILKATEEMVGKYKCVASNDLGSTETAAKFDIITKPKFIKGLENMQVLEGDHVSMTVQIAGFPNPEISFYKDGQDVSAEATIVVKKEMDDIYVLEIENIRIIMSGEYECRIRNEAGEASSHGLVTVNGKPRFEKNLTDVQVKSGEDIALEVCITGNPSPDVKWFVNGKETAGTERILLDTRDEIYALKIRNATEPDAGVYHCVAMNDFGKCDSEKCKLDVIKHEFAPVFNKHIEDTIVVVEDNVRFETAISASPEAEVTWCRDGVPLKPNDKVLISRDGDKHVLILKDLKIADSGVISCKAQNEKGFNADTAKLSVHEPTLPSISGLSDISLIHGEPLDVEAIVTGYPKPFVNWYKDGEAVDSHLVNSEPQYDRYKLKFKNFTEEMAGKYTCSAVNSAGEAMKKFSLNISGRKPTFTKELEENIIMSVGKENNKLKLGQSAVFETIVDGIPTPSVTWLKNDETMRPNNRVMITNVDDEHRLEIKEITKDDVAKYTCKAENVYGEALSVCLLKFLNEPHAPIIKKPLEDIRVEESEPVILQCKVDGEPMPAVKWFKDGTPLEQCDRAQISSKSDGSTSITIPSPVLADSGTYEVRVENAKGDAVTKAKLLVVEQQRSPKFTKPLKELVKVEFNCPLILEATVFGLPPPRIEWTKDGTPIDRSKSPQMKTKMDEQKGECILQIDHAKSDDAGCYAVKATNPNGEALSTSTVQVMPEPFAPMVIENLPVKVQVVQGEPIELHAKVTAYPFPKVTWNKDKHPIDNRKDVQVVVKPDGDLNLKIDSSKLNDAGIYSVTVENSVGEVAISTQVNVLKPSEAPKTIVSKELPRKMNLVEGSQPLILSAQVDGIEPIDVTWQKEGKPIVAANSDAAIKEDNGVYSLVIEKPSVADSGVYALVIRTPDGKKLQTNSQVVVAKAKGPFSVLECLPSKLSIKSGEDLRMAMKLENCDLLSPESIRVFKDDKPLAIDNGLVTVTTTDSGDVQLLQAKCSPLDSGVYRIEIQTPDESISNSCQVQVIDPKQADGINKPKFRKELSSLEVESGSPCLLECAIEGNPNDFSISWYKDGEEIVPNEHYGLVKEPDGRLALLIDSLSAKDSGKYSVIVKNAAGEACTLADVATKSVIAKAKPAFIEQLAVSPAEEKSPLIMKAKIVSKSPFESKWYHDGDELKESDRIKFVKLPDGTVMLQIENAAMSDSGAYKLEVKNDSGKVDSEAKVTVQAKQVEPKPLTITQGLAPTTLTAGEPGFLELQVDTDKDVDIKFLQNGKQVLPNDRVHIQQLPGGVIRLTFDNVQLEDQGDYIALFSNDGQQVQTGCPLTVLCKPIITKSLTDLTIKEGCSAKFEVAVKGNPAPSLIWMKNGLDISTESRPVTMTEGPNGSYILQLDKCNFRDEAKYSVIATNNLGEDTSSSKLNVISSEHFEECAPTFIKGLQDMTVKKGDTITLTAEIKSHPVPEIVWKIDGQIINKSARVLTTFDGSIAQLTVSNADASDFGLYELVAANNLGEISSKANVVTMQESAPKFIKPLSDTEANVKVQTKLSCRVSGYPEPEIFWLFNGKAIESGVKYSIFKELDENVLIIFNPTEIDSGSYECRAQNHLGSDRTEASVHFIERDKKGEAAAFLTKLTDYDVLPNGTARFTACVIGNPKPDITWFMEGKEITIDGDKYFVEYKDNGMIRFEVRNVTQADIGRYRCHASNVYGYDNSIAQLNLETHDGLDRMEKTHKSQKSQKRAMDADDVDFKTTGLPIPLPDQPKITKMTDNSLTLIWLPSVPEQPRFPVSYIVEFGKVADGQWVTYQTEIKNTKCEVTGLEPFEDYSFRIRVQNKFGTSDPSPAVTAFRSKLKVDHEQKEHKPADYDIAHTPREKIAAAPKFLREEESFMYGICGQPVTIEFWVYGYPEPDITWLFGEEKIEHNHMFNFMQDRNGKVCLFINKMDISDVGYYTCVAKNEHGEERKTIKLVQAAAPVFTKRLEETTVMARNHVRLECAFTATPDATIKWFKDFQPLHDTSRMNIISSTDGSILTISDCITRDMGLYSCTVTNLAGSTTTAAFVHVTESDVNYSKYPFSYGKTLKPQNKPIEQFYDLGDEVGRGTQGIVYHAVERSTGKSFASKMMHGIGETKQFMMAECDVMNQLGSHDKLIHLHDVFAPTPHSLSLITDMCDGGTLLDFILKKGQLTENEVAHYARQILDGLQYMHFKNIGHFGLTIGDILMERINGPDIKICDFGLSHRVIPGMRHYVEYGHPEFVSPEIVSKNSVTFSTDIWSAGIIIYILFTGISPFLAENDRATLQNIQNKKLDLSNQALSGVSEQGRDFIRKMLDLDPNNRLDVKGALNHPWLKLASNPEEGTQLNVMDKLRDYQGRNQKWYQNASCKRYYRRRELHSCFTHPSRMIYPPDENYSPLVSPDREIRKYNKTISPFENVYPPNVMDGENFKSESHYQSGPDTYLLQLRDTGFPARIRRYLRIAATSSPSINYNLKQSHWGSNLMASFTGHVPQVSIKERRKFTDVMDEEISDEIRGTTNRSKPMRLVRELGTSSYAYGQLSSIRRETKPREQIDETLTAPFFREKLKDIAFKPGDNVLFSCFAIGNPEPTYTWFRNDSILIESSRVTVKRTTDGRCQFNLKPAREYDVGIYKCIARNSQGSVMCRARLNIGSVCEHLNPPCIKDGSANSLLLTWNQPRFTGHSPIKHYRLEYKRVEEENWLIMDANIKQEYYIATDLQPDTSFCFRVSAYNQFGWSNPSAPSEVAKTLPLEENKHLAIPVMMLYDCNTTEKSSNDDAHDLTIPDIDYSRETNPVQLIKSDFKELYDFKSIISKGKFSLISRVYIKDGTRCTLACKCVLSQSENESSIDKEYQIMKSLAHERIASLRYANRDASVFSLAMDLSSGLNVLTYFSRKLFYTEESVCIVVAQVLDAIEYLHYRGIALIELQPDNVLVVDDRRLQIKLTDFASARHIERGGSKVSVSANPEYIAPEIIKNEEVTLPYTDVWSVGVLAYILLSGHSPFRGSDPKETAQNVVYVRYLFDRLYPDVTQEAIRFILTVFKLTPHKRPTIEECHENKWLLPNEFMIRKRHLAIFGSAKLSEFSDEFFQQKQSSHSRLLDLMGLSE